MCMHMKFEGNQREERERVSSGKQPFSRDAEAETLGEGRFYPPPSRNFSLLSLKL